LFHCSNLQGVILGVGLSMVQKLFVQQTQGDPRENNSKKRKAAGATSSSIPDDDDEDTYYGSGASKKKGGIGYAGNVKEDVSLGFFLSISFSLLYRILVNSRLVMLRRPKMRHWQVYSELPVSTFLLSIEKEVATQAITYHIQQLWLTCVDVLLMCARLCSEMIHYQTCLIAIHFTLNYSNG
jgi:hypothetical protein